MKLNLKNPLAFLDVETTGTNCIHDRIIEIAVIKLLPNEECHTFTKRLNPNCPIPPASSLIHGMYDQDVKDAPHFKDIAKELAKFLQGCDLAGFNMLRLDIPILVESFLRAGVDFNFSKRKLIDVQKLFFLMEKRNLAAAYQFYCQKELKGAHSALVDTQATVEILKAQIARYQAQPVTDAMGNVLGTVENDMQQLHDLMTSTMIDLAGRLVYNQAGTPVFNFGKHKDKPVAQVLQEEPGYYHWMMKGDFSLDTKRHLTQLQLASHYAAPGAPKPLT